MTIYTVVLLVPSELADLTLRLDTVTIHVDAEKINEAVIKAQETAYALARDELASEEEDIEDFNCSESSYIVVAVFEGTHVNLSGGARLNDAHTRTRIQAPRHFMAGAFLRSRLTEGRIQALVRYPSSITFTHAHMGPTIFAPPMSPVLTKITYRTHATTEKLSGTKRLPIV
jgi:hypothetical protein